MCVTVVALFASGNGQGAAADRVDLGERARRSAEVVLATVLDVQGSFETNAFGDQLIVSNARVRVDERLKASSEPSRTGPVETGTVLTVQVEGGTVGDLTLSVSDVPTIEAGERAVLLLDRLEAGTYVPHDRGRGILKLDERDRVHGTDMTLDDVRASVRAAGR